MDAPVGPHYHAVWGNRPRGEVLSVLKKALATEPAVILGFIAAVITAVVQEVPAGSSVSWSAVVPLVLAAVVRQFTFAPAHVRVAEPAAREAPLNVAKALKG